MSISATRRAAKNQPCTVRLPGVCKPTPDHETSVLAHLPHGGMGAKRGDHAAAFCCFECHEYLDGRKHADPPFEKGFLEYSHLRGVMETQDKLVKMGLLWTR